MANGDDLGFVAAAKADDLGFVPAGRRQSPIRRPGDTRPLTQQQVDTFSPPTQLEKEHPQIKPYYGFTPGNILGQAKRGIGELGSGIYETGKDILFPEGETEGDKLRFLGKKYIFDPADRETALARRGDQTAAESIGHSIASVLPLVGPWAASLGEQAGSGDPGGALGRGGAQALAGLAAKPILGAAAKRLPSTGDIGMALRTEKGALRPGVATIGLVGGTMLGTGTGHLTGIPGAAEAGGIAGALGGRALMDALIPEHPNLPGWSVKLPGRLKMPLPEPADPFAGMTSSRAPLGSAELPAIPQSTPTLFPEVRKLGTPPKKGLIVSPDSPPPDVRVTYQSVPQPDLLKMVRSGDAAAITEWQRRGLQLPENVGFLVEGNAGTFPWRRYKR